MENLQAIKKTIKLRKDLLILTNVIYKASAKRRPTRFLNVKKDHCIGAVGIESIYRMHAVDDFVFIFVQQFVVDVCF